MHHHHYNTHLLSGHGLDNSLFLCSQLPPKSFNHRDMPESSPNRYSTHILSHNHCHPMCICDDIVTRKSLKFTFIHTVSTFHCFYALNFRQSPSIIQISQIILLCICGKIGTEQSLKFTFVQTVTTFHSFYPLNFHQSPSMIDICRIEVHTGTAHIFGLTTTSIPCIFVNQ
jgi:hypothetical protein